MIEIKSITEADAKVRCEQLSLPLCHVLEMTDKGQVLGTACVSCDGEEAYLRYLHASDPALTDALLRATLNFVLAEGAVWAYILPFEVGKMMFQKGYTAESDCPKVKIVDFFAKRCCNG